MNKLIFATMAIVGLILTPAVFAGGDCSYSAVKKLQTAKADSDACAAKQAIQVAIADGADCSSKASAQKVALANGADCAASLKAVKVAQKSDLGFRCDSKARTIVLAKADSNASDGCGGCPNAKLAPAVAKSTDDAPVVVAAKE